MRHGGQNLRSFPLLRRQSMVQRLEDPRQTVNTQVEQGATSEVKIDHAVLRAKLRLNITTKRVVGCHAKNLAELALFNYGSDRNARGEVASPDGLHEEELLLLGDLAERFCLSGVDGECLLAENMLVRFQAESDILVVVRMRGRDIDDVDVGVFHEFRV